MAHGHVFCWGYYRWCTISQILISVLPLKCHMANPPLKCQIGLGPPKSSYRHFGIGTIWDATSHGRAQFLRMSPPSRWKHLTCQIDLVLTSSGPGQAKQASQPAVRKARVTISTSCMGGGVENVRVHFQPSKQGQHTILTPTKK